METQMGFMAMPGVGFFGLLLIGIIAGYVAERAMKRDHGLLTNMIVGIAGSFVGGALAGVLNINYYGFAGNLVVAVVGAILILWIFSRSKRG
nr:GlsB/YeaQ/YmgE family stress response membrane protein [Hoeflea phototrophica]